MFGVQRLADAALRAVLLRHGHVRDGSLLGVLYVGLGDPFDDERRLVRARQGPAADGSLTAPSQHETMDA